MADRTLRNTDAPAKIALALLIAGALTLGCTGTRLAFKYMSSCPAEGPETSSDLGLLPIPVNLEDFYADVMARGNAFAISELGAVRHRETRRPILSIRHQGRSAERKMLIVAAIHGNESAGLLAVAPILDLLESGRPEHAYWDVTVVAPANPVGLVEQSRYNADGCDINRDFDEMRTYEAELIRTLIETERPDVVVSLHEGAQDGYLLVVTSAGSEALGKATVRAVDARGITLASKHFTGVSLREPGLSAEGRGTDFLKWLGALHTLGRFNTGLGIGTYTSETDWASDNFAERVLAHVVTVEALLRAGAPDPPPARHIQRPTEG